MFELACITLVFLLAGYVKGVIGMGLPTIAMATLGLLLEPAQAAALLVIPSLVTNEAASPLAGVTPTLLSLAITSGFLSAVDKAFDNLATTSFGVLAGANTAYQAEKSNCG